METRQLERTENLLKLANERVQLPKVWQKLKYFEEVDLLVVKVSNAPATHSKGDDLNGLVYNYDADNNLASIEILDLYGIFVSEFV